MNNQDLIFASLMGIKNYQTFERLEVVQNELSKHVLPVLPFLPFQNKDEVIQKQYEYALRQNNLVDEIHPDKQFFKCGFSLRNSNVIWYFPYEPLISVSGGNAIDKVNVSRHGTDKKGNLFGGTMKSRTKTKDFEITITGVFFGKQESGKPEDCYPGEKIIELMKFLTSQNEIQVFHEELFLLGVTHIVIEDYSFPFTKGENMQAFEIKAISDDPNHSLIVKD